MPLLSFVLRPGIGDTKVLFPSQEGGGSETVQSLERSTPWCDAATGFKEK